MRKSYVKFIAMEVFRNKKSRLTKNKNEIFYLSPLSTRKQCTHITHHDSPFGIKLGMTNTPPQWDCTSFIPNLCRDGIVCKILKLLINNLFTYLYKILFYQTSLWLKSNNTQKQMKTKIKGMWCVYTTSLIDGDLFVRYLKYRVLDCLTDRVSKSFTNTVFNIKNL